MSSVDIDALLKRLGLGAVNPGTWSGSHGWSDATDAALLKVRNPSDGTLLAQVRPASAQDYEHVVSSAVEAAAGWRDVPAPKRSTRSCCMRAVWPARRRPRSKKP